ncbi:MAG: sigma-70 family RNA polymerase sigma factor [Planctomycetes bacterium]|nr:sigma-70 family RNA polymerase sigma factor [Planctomycetota bacterium]
MDDLKASIEKARKGDAEAFGTLVERFSPAVRALCLMHSSDPGGADDIAQQVFLTAWNRLPTLQDDMHFWAWLKSIARNHLQNDWRRVSRERAFKQRYAVNWLAERTLESVEADDAPELLVTRMESLRGCIDALPEHFKKLIKLYYEEKRTSKEIGAELERSSDAVRQALVAMREKLRLCVERKLAEQGPHA